MSTSEVDNVKEEEEKAVQTSKVSSNRGGVGGKVMQNVKLTAWVFITENARKENSIYSIELQRKGVS